MTEPLVCGILLTADRHEMTRRAIASFEQQSYARKCLVILDSGREPMNLRSSIHQIYVTTPHDPNLTIGELRNMANGLCGNADLLAHFDSDDWSHPERLQEQVADLTAGSWASTSIPPECVGYNDMVFWDTRAEEAWFYTHHGSRYALGASMCYWREAWKRNPFPRTSRGEDKLFGYRVRVRGYVSKGPGFDPRMICEIHGGNTGSHITPGHEQWARVPHWDDYCKVRMEIVKETYVY